LLVPPQNSDALWNAVRFLVEHPDDKKKMTKQALAYIRLHTSHDEHARLKLAVIQDFVLRAAR